MDERLRVCRSAKEAIPSLSTCIPEALDAGDNLDGSRRFIMSRFVWHDLDKTKTFETLWSLGLDIISIHRLCPSLRAKHVPSFVASTIVLPWMNVNLCLRHLRKHRVTLTLPCSSTALAVWAEAVLVQVVLKESQTTNVAPQHPDDSEFICTNMKKENTIWAKHSFCMFMHNPSKWVSSFVRETLSLFKVRAAAILS